MKTIFILSMLTIAGYYLSKFGLYIIDETCYLLLDLCIRIDIEWLQKGVSKILGV